MALDEFNSSEVLPNKEAAMIDENEDINDTTDLASSTSFMSKIDVADIFSETKAYIRKRRNSLTTAGERVLDNLSVFADNMQIFANETSEKVIGRVEVFAQNVRYRLVHFDELPTSMKDNNYIHTKYRQVSGYMECWKSIFKVHNETVNIWTHLLGALLFVYLIIQSYFTFPKEADIGDYVFFMHVIVTHHKPIYVFVVSITWVSVLSFVVLFVLLPTMDIIVILNGVHSISP
jgi:hypothetical protein